MGGWKPSSQFLDHRPATAEQMAHCAKQWTGWNSRDLGLVPGSSTGFQHLQKIHFALNSIIIGRYFGL